jgi:CBS domain-containing protein
LLSKSGEVIPMIVQDIMTREPYVALVSDSIRTVLTKLAEADVRHLPVTENGAVVGIVSDRDLRGVVPSTLESIERPAESEQILARSIATLMSSDVVSVSPGDDVIEAIDLITEHRVGALPVVDAGTSNLVGIVSYVDALRAARELLARE